VNAESLEARLRKQGLSFSSLRLIHEGDYAPNDADWNYKDVPHLDEVHHLVSSTHVLVREDLVLTLFLQKVGPFSIPLNVVNLATSADSQLYYTSAFFFVLIIETSWVSIGPNKCRVTTQYRIGSTPFLRFVHPIIRKVLEKNYTVLMSADIPMREQRGRLRTRGFTFRADTSGYTFQGTTNLAENNVQYPASSSWKTEQISLDRITREGESGLTLPNEHVRFAIVGNEVVAFPTICPHEGASLVNCEIDERGLIRCPWHGRQIPGKRLQEGIETEVHANCVATQNQKEISLQIGQP
jgi:nitrite reductase/ring-hydroxylating ferredoxin subunit